MKEKNGTRGITINLDRQSHLVYVAGLLNGIFHWNAANARPSN